ncbi:hypothetical protein CLV30_13324 [Haloactinopolyspora alba]|uniref:Uncharacterized protein n=1 Tax=Haloactinopolyspora alba TaxID=648780 RepID=A0A2P8D3V2_9ACTN|nr:hypothetical protein [Haloactinopolyspora alba]PSK91891.1 hypothetical protein CLV30_13324 [Haloactinopolyspora alba]
MTLQASEIQRIDYHIVALNKYRHECTDPVELIQTTARIDGWLDERLVFMQVRDHLEPTQGPQVPARAGHGSGDTR